MDKELFKKTERKLYNYFNKDKKIQAILKKIEILNQQIECINKKLKCNDIKIPEESKSISYDERVQTSKTGMSYAEMTMLKIADKMEKEISRKNEEVASLEEEIRNIELDNVILEYNITFLKAEDKDFLKLKYGERKKDWQIGTTLNMSQPTASRTRQRLIEDVTRWEEYLSLNES